MASEPVSFHYDLVKIYARQYRLDPILVGSIIEIESNWDAWAVRFEPAWRYYLDITEHAEILGISRVTEQTMQACSWGLGQIMGSVARQYGFEDHLQKLCLPEINLEYMCRHLQNFMQRYGVETDAISSYNQGSPRLTPGGMYQNQVYVDKVSAVLRKYRALE